MRNASASLTLDPFRRNRLSERADSVLGLVNRPRGSRSDTRRMREDNGGEGEDAGGNLGHDITPGAARRRWVNCPATRRGHLWGRRRAGESPQFHSSKNQYEDL